MAHIAQSSFLKVSATVQDTRKQDGGLLSVKFEELGRIKVIRGAAVS